ncbi:MAG: hypothetical protein ACTTKH_02435 [Treponema sp.]
MKHMKIVSVVVALIIISAVTLITGCSQTNDNSMSINGVWKSTLPRSENDLKEGLTDVYLAFDGQMHIYAYRKKGILCKGASCAYTISGNSITLAGKGTYNFNINNNVLTTGAYMGSWVKTNTPTLEEIQNALHD